MDKSGDRSPLIVRDLPPSRFNDSPPVKMGTLFDSELQDIEDEAPRSDSEYNEYPVNDMSLSKNSMSFTNLDSIPVVIPPPSEEELAK